MNLHTELVKNGYVAREATHLAELVDATVLDFVKTNDNFLENYPKTDQDQLSRLLGAIHYQIGLEFIEPYAKSYEQTKAALWESSLPRHKTWHSDVKEADDVFFLLYFSDQRSTNDGALLIKNTDGEHRFVPRPGLIIGLENTDPYFLHMVEPTIGKRVVGAFGFKVEWNNDNSD
jgi:hypothetical protein